MVPSPTSPKQRTGSAYIRVSTNDQMELSPESQLKEILKYADLNGISVKEDFIFMEKEGRSGKRAENRPEFQRMIATAKTLPRPFDLVLVWKFSRFARNQDESTFYKGMLRKKLGIDIISVSEPILDGMYGRLIELIIEWQDEFYSCNLSAEVHRGMEQKALSGGYQSAFPFGYRPNGPGKPPVVIRAQANIVKTIFTLYVTENLNITDIARQLNVQGHTTKNGNCFERRTVSYILQNPFYAGKLCWNRNPRKTKKKDMLNEENTITVKGQHKAIISEELFEAAAKRIEQERRSPSVRNVATCRHFLSGLIKCPYCGSGLSYSSSQSPSFQCWKYAKGLHCGSASISERKVMMALEKSLYEMGLYRILDFLKNPSVSEFDKGEGLRSVLQEIIYDRDSNTFQLYYHL